ncbi:tryptophan--tRNA ligase [Helicovermis profundi]|uniref:Tryptophan--tRNA ligase n=1 Tax=Helicovermis profundi TaxID=3065157 RepID=A0AAU9E8X6_9FIRM|nr:tryptophan--tRNA ligase [Clostridia bacterium S502]
MKRVLSGVQPSGEITLGNYITMKNFVNLQKYKDCYYCVVDLHSITVPQDPKKLYENSLQLAALYMAIGINPNESTLFLQSQVSAHAELAWLLQCNTYLGELSRMTQFKEKSKGKKAFSTGLYTYPILMAADILLYDTNYVPVGDDQKQHLELTRDIAIRFNNKFGDTFVIPEPLISKKGARIMSLDDPTTKMSKSNPNTHSKISLLDSPNKVKKSIMKSTTDSEMLIKYDLANKPGVSNLLTIYSSLTDISIEELETKYINQGYGNLKKDLVNTINDSLFTIQNDYTRILKSGEAFDVLKEGSKRANEVATKVLDKAKKNMGFITF